MPGDPRLEEAIVLQVNKAVKDSQEQLLGHLDQLNTTRLGSFQKTFSTEQKDWSESQISKLQTRIADPYKFKKAGNEQQFLANEKVVDTLKEAHFHLGSGSDESIHVAAGKIGEGMDLLHHRQKLIKLADSSELGWKVVKEYETHQLAEDSDDEKRILKAEARANRKAKQFVVRGRGRRYTPYQTPYQTPTMQPSPF